MMAKPPEGLVIDCIAGRSMSKSARRERVGDERNHPLVDWSTRKSYQEACEISAWSSEVKARNDALNLFTKRTFSVAVKGSLRRASTPLTEDFQVTNRSSHSIDIKREKKDM